MRDLIGAAILGTTLAVALIVSVWLSLPIQAKPQFAGVSIDPLGMTTTATNLLPEVQYDQGTIFLPPGVRYDQ